MQFQDLLLSEVIPVWGAVGSITTLFQTASLVASLILSFSELWMLPAYVQYVLRIYVWKSWMFNLLKLSWKMYKMNKAEGACMDFSSWKCVQLCRIRLKPCCGLLKWMEWEEEWEEFWNEILLRRISMQPCVNLTPPHFALSSEILKHTFTI